MTIFIVLLLKLIPLYGVILLGYLIGYFFKMQKDFLAKSIIYVIAPIVIFTGVITTKITFGTLSVPLLFFFVCCFISFLTYYISGFIWKDATKNIMAFIAGTSNTGYLGIPIAIALFGNSVIGIVALVVLGTSLYTNSVGLYIAARGKYSVKESIYTIIKIPILYAFFVGLLVNLVNIHFGQLYFETVNIFNGAYILIGMFLIGLGLAEIKGFSFNWKFVGITFFAEFILWPFVMISLLFFDGITFHFYSGTLYKVILIMSVLPVATNVIAYTALLKTHSKEYR